jgi:hypothetical protein
MMDSRLKQEVDFTPYSEWWPDLLLDTWFHVGFGGPSQVNLEFDDADSFILALSIILATKPRMLCKCE